MKIQLIHLLIMAYAMLKDKKFFIANNKNINKL